MKTLFIQYANVLIYSLVASCLAWLSALCLGRRVDKVKNFSLKIKPAYQPGKPPWVQHEVLRLKALMPQGTGVRKIAATPKHARYLATYTAQTARRYGSPKSVRTDNESCFTSQAYTVPLKLQGIRVQRSDMHCPWQNGRIERLFGSLQQHLNRISFDTAEQLQTLLNEFMVWYNTIRPHQHLQGRTPEEVWRGVDYTTTAPRSMDWCTGWDGLLSGAKLKWT
jgi:hypothetical protein